MEEPVTLDVRGLHCPLPVLKANKALRGMKPGGELVVLATDPAAVKDFHAFAGETGHELLAWGEEEGHLRFVLRRKSEG
ncbi:sulfurtransferase TusA family protein [Sabulicella rubraurantiaca]|uniref:sulfurtransferase TusA family protein n=1 Tax=Sabulicella rubraurantiaca TaxID=2811429 RepID=UPI001A96D06C|nr:sulfurtransferase TusA family protein [Sabulicella rubraurantiaca]